MSDTHFEIPREREFSRPAAAAYIRGLRDEGTPFGLACCLWRFVPTFLTEEEARARWVELCGSDDADQWRAAGTVDRKWVAVLPDDGRLVDHWELLANPFGAPRLAVGAWLRQTRSRWVYWQGQFWLHTGQCYEPVEEDGVRARLFHDFGLAVTPTQVTSVDPVTGQRTTIVEDRPVHPTTKIMVELVAALKSMTYRPSELPVVPGLVFRNGVLDPATGTLSPVDRDDFRVSSIDADYSPDAQCPRWERFVAEVLPDPDQQALLQETLGYLLSGRTDRQKMFCWVGEPRAGKGTILRVVERLLGRRAVAGVSLSDLAGPFGLEVCRSASVIALGEARLSRETRPVVDLLLRISGEDSVTVNIKNKPAVTTRLPGRVVLLSNELPAILEDSGALAGRFVHLEFRVSFLGREDRSLDARLAAELPGIAAWALRGLARLQAQGQFTATAAGQRQSRALGEMSNHAKLWMTERLDFGGEASVTFSDVEQDYHAWCDRHDIEESVRHSTTRLGRMLTSKGCGNTLRKERGSVNRVRTGVRLRPEVTEVTVTGFLESASETESLKRVVPNEPVPVQPATAAPADLLPEADR